ncbi:hypothetical protein [Acetonema longum]|uniref:Uncharacterized protein n=1 Tax=Acetonema longum DSM 6540 TaxID=1009370 RepID=F7NJK1_9FIRM|nr:hypothetical protein [Acetonema longum]EGO63779.1 hypothetical protein ALO_11284 [Acetonema longum DSM 6540]
MLGLFISYKGNFSNVVALVEKLIERSLVITRDEIGEKCIFQLFNIEFVLMGNHELEDDFGIAFTNYEIHINMIPLNSGQEIDGYIKMFNSISLYLADKISKTLKTEIIVVEDLQEIVYKSNRGQGY